MDALKTKKYMSFYQSRLGVVSVVASVALIAWVLLQSTDSEQLDYYNDLRSIIVVIGGTFGCLIYQYDLDALFRAILIIFYSMFKSPDKEILPIIKELDQCILDQTSIMELREPDKLTGKLLDDVIFMNQEGLEYEEIEDFISQRIYADLLQRKITVSLLERGAKIAPALGLLGTVLGLIELLRQLNDPTEIGPAMSLALMTTAFGVVTGTLFFTPLAGRISNHNVILVDTHTMLFKRLRILLRRDEMNIDHANLNQQAGGDDEAS